MLLTARPAYYSSVVSPSNPLASLSSSFSFCGEAFTRLSTSAICSAGRIPGTPQLAVGQLPQGEYCLKRTSIPLPSRDSTILMLLIINSTKRMLSRGIVQICFQPDSGEPTVSCGLPLLVWCHSEEREARRRISNSLQDKCARFFATLRMTDRRTFSTVPKLWGTLLLVCFPFVLSVPVGQTDFSFSEMHLSEYNPPAKPVNGFL